MKDILLNFWRGLCAVPVGLFWRVMYRPVVIGLENVPASGGVLLASNHISGWETMFLPYFVVAGFGPFSRRQIWAPAKEELFFFPLGLLLKSWRAFPVRRNQHDYASMDKLSALAAEHVVMIFPEGTRSKDGALKKGKPGVGKVIYDAKPVVLPCVVFNTNYCTPKGRWFPRFFLPLAVVYGKPMDLSRFYAMPPAKETSRMIVDEVMSAIGALQKEYAHLDMHHPAHKRP